MLVHKAKEYFEQSSSLAHWCPAPFKAWNQGLYVASMKPQSSVTRVPSDRDYFTFLTPPPLIFTRRRDQPSGGDNKPERVHNLFFMWSCLRKPWLQRLQAPFDQAARERWRLTRQQWNDLLSGLYFRRLWPAPAGNKLCGDFDITNFWKHGWGPLFDDTADEMRPVPMFGDRPLNPSDFTCDNLKAIVAYDVAIHSIHHQFVEADLALTGDETPDRKLAQSLVFQRGLALAATSVPTPSDSREYRLAWMRRFLGLVKDWPQCGVWRLPPIDPDETDEGNLRHLTDLYIPVYYQGIMDTLRIPPTMLFQAPVISDVYRSMLASL